MKSKHENIDYYYCDRCGDMFMKVGSTVIGMAHPQAHVYLTPKKLGQEYICPKHRRNIT